MTYKHQFQNKPYYFKNQNEYGETWDTEHWGGYDLRNIESDNSPRVNGKLKIRYNNAHIYRSSFFRRPGSIDREIAPDLPHRKYALGTVWYPWVSTFDDTSAKASLTSRLASRMRVAASDYRFNAGEALAERRQTVQLVADTASTLAGAFRDIRRGRVPKVFQHVEGVDWTKRASNIWLQYHYGWKPLLQDVAGALTLLVSRPLTYELSATVKETDRREFDFHQTTNEGEFHCYGQAIVEYKMRGNARVRIEEYDRFTDQTGLGNPLLLAWELLPYSFVVDWFVQVGNFLEALNGFNGVTILESCVTYTRSFRMWASTDKTKNDLSDGMIITGQGLARGSDTVIDRTLGLPSLTVPHVKTKLSLTKFVTSLALLKQQFGR